MTTIFLDIDGTLFLQTDRVEDINSETQVSLKGSADKCFEWHCQGYNIILTTGRPESMRAITTKQLQRANIIYDQLVMGLGQGHRILVNNNSIEGLEKAHALCTGYNEGIHGLSIAMDYEPALSREED